MSVQQYLKDAKQWCEEVSQAMEMEPQLLNSWQEQLKEIEQAAGNEKEKDVLAEKVQSLYREWDEFYQRLEGREVPIGGHKLPPLPYRYNALEPYIDEETMRLHHDIHHQSYVDGLNKAEKEMAKARRTNDFALIKHWEREAAFNGAGHYLHSIFWKVMCPSGGGKPAGGLERELAHSFGSFSDFKKHFSAAAEKVEGGGWAILVWSPQAQRMEILQAEKHQNLSQWDVVPLLVLDVWEHAYYLKYKTKRKEYIENWWNIVCWDEVHKRLKRAKKHG
ncbi:superoxide dismutase [Bacillus xiapuensis]|uniref:superoxide dismutase n=1 Tax=Bacillus xiapuensis TaxID=2014075 RepID=UPI000C249D31|nr:superoxide dismutase [Bacillus xiapuensis]